jgi:hypothetical protein
VFYFHKFHINFEIIGAKNPAININEIRLRTNSGAKYNIGAIHAAKQLPQLKGL